MVRCIIEKTENLAAVKRQLGHKNASYSMPYSRITDDELNGESKKAFMKRSPCSCWHLYVIRTDNQSLYAGISIDVQRRFREHVAQGRKTAKYLLAHKPRCLVFLYPVGSRSLALKVERCFKKMPKIEKEKIVDSQELIFNQETGMIF